jgi:hypothetical protein
MSLITRLILMIWHPLTNYLFSKMKNELYGRDFPSDDDFMGAVDLFLETKTRPSTETGSVWSMTAAGMYKGIITRRIGGQESREIFSYRAMQSKSVEVRSRTPGF